MRTRHIRPAAQKNRSARTSGKTGLFLWVFSLAGVAMLGFGIYLTQDEWTFRQTAARAWGTVVKLEYRRSEDGGSYYPIIDWKAPDGSLRRFHSRMGSSPPAYDEGERVEVLYDPKNWRDVRHSGWIGWLASVVLLFMGSIFSAVPWLMRRSVRREQAEAERLQRYGRKIEARVVEAEVLMQERMQKMQQHVPQGVARYIKTKTRHTTMAGQYMAQWEDPASGKWYLYPLGKLTPEQLGAVYAGEGTITLLVDPENPNIFQLPES